MAIAERSEKLGTQTYFENVDKVMSLLRRGHVGRPRSPPEGNQRAPARAPLRAEQDVAREAEGQRGIVALSNTFPNMRECCKVHANGARRA